MPKFKVSLKYNSYYQTEVEAKDAEQAVQYAQAKLDNEDFDFKEPEDCEIEEVEE